MYIFKKTPLKLFNADNNFKLKKFSLLGSTEVPGDKSISQRALIIGLVSIGQTVIKDILDSEDVYYTLNAIEALGAKVDINKNKKTVTVKGVGLGNFKSPKKLNSNGIIRLSNFEKKVKSKFKNTEEISTYTGDDKILRYY